MKKKSYKQIRQMHEDLDDEPRMNKCFTCPKKHSLERHHALIYGGRKVEESYAIIALCGECHRGNSGTIYREVDLVCKLAAITMGREHLEKNYPKCNWLQEKLRYENELVDLINIELCSNEQLGGSRNAK